jgi:hypothetical protein
VARRRAVAARDSRCVHGHERRAAPRIGFWSTNRLSYAWQSRPVECADRERACGVRQEPRAGAMVIAMLPDLRFVLGATLAAAMLAAAGVGVVASVELVHEAHMGPLEARETLAYAGPAERNEFYDPENARRFMEAVGKLAPPTPQAPIEASPESLARVAPAMSQERSERLEPDRIEPAVPAERAAAAEPPLSESPATEPPAVATPGATKPATEISGAIESSEPPGERVRTANVPEGLPQADDHIETAAAPPQAALGPLQDPAHPPAPAKVRARPKVVRHVRRPAPAPAPPQMFQNGFSTNNNQWPNYWTSEPPTPPAPPAAKKPAPPRTGSAG